MKYVVVLAALLATNAGAQTVSVKLAETLRAGLAAESGADAKAMMQAAAKLRQLGAHPAEGDPDLAQIWTQKAQALGARPVSEPVWRGRVLGPAYRSGELMAHAQFTTRQSFVAGQKADVVVEPVGAVQLGLNVSDGEGNPVCTVSASRKILGCRWVPVVTDINIITVSNPAPRAVRFYLILN